MWTIYLFLSPFYLFQSGYPQPADILIFLAICLYFALTLLNFQKEIRSVYVFGAMFVGLAFTINFIHYFFMPDIKFILHSFIYLFNFFIFMFVVMLFDRDRERMNHVTYKTLLIIVAFQFLMVVFFPDSDDVRASGTFNKSNQLAYWCVLAAALLLVLKRNTRFTIIDLAAFSILSYMQMLTLSKAGIIVFFLLFIMFVSSPNMPRRYRYIVILFAALFSISYMGNAQKIYNFFMNFDTVDAVSKRLGTLGKQNDDTPEARGYLRLIEHPGYLLIGAGEGAYQRFGRQELHSGIATLLFSYGIFGFGFFIAFLASAFYRLSFYYSAMLMPIFLFGLTHQNIRFSFFWIFLAVAYAGHFFKNNGVYTETHKKDKLVLYDEGVHEEN